MIRKAGVLAFMMAGIPVMASETAVESVMCSDDPGRNEIRLRLTQQANKLYTLTYEADLNNLGDKSIIRNAVLDTDMSCRAETIAGLPVLKCTGPETSVDYSIPKAGIEGEKITRGVFTISLRQTVRQGVDDYSENDSVYEVEFKKGHFGIGEVPKPLSVWATNPSSDEQRLFEVKAHYQSMVVTPDRCVFKP